MINVLQIIVMSRPVRYLPNNCQMEAGTYELSGRGGGRFRRFNEQLSKNGKGVSNLATAIISQPLTAVPAPLTDIYRAVSNEADPMMMERETVGIFELMAPILVSAS